MQLKEVLNKKFWWKLPILSYCDKQYQIQLSLSSNSHVNIKNRIIKANASKKINNKKTNISNNKNNKVNKIKEIKKNNTIV